MKYQDLKRETRKLWGTRRVEVVLVVVGALSAVSKRLNTWLDKLGGLPLIWVCCRKQLCWEQHGSLWYWKVEGGEITQGTFGHWLWPAPLV